MRTYWTKGLMILVGGVAIAGASCGGNGGGSGERVVAVTSGNRLVQFRVGDPEGADDGQPISGIVDSIVGIDFRPANGLLYALTSGGDLYTVDVATAVASLVSTVSEPLVGTSFGVDFNPVPDRLRIVSDLDQNLRVNVDTGAATVDGTLAFALGDANEAADPNVVAAAYSNNVAGAATTTLFTMDGALDILATQNPPNAGTQNTIGALGVDAGNVSCFDIAPGNDSLAIAAIAGGAGSTLYTIDTASGAATPIGAIGSGETIVGCSIRP